MHREYLTEPDYGSWTWHFINNLSSNIGWCFGYFNQDYVSIFFFNKKYRKKIFLIRFWVSCVWSQKNDRLKICILNTDYVINVKFTYIKHEKIWKRHIKKLLTFKKKFFRHIWINIKNYRLTQWKRGREEEKVKKMILLF